MITEWLLISCPALANNPMDAGWGDSGGSGQGPQLTKERKDTKVGSLGRTQQQQPPLKKKFKFKILH
ncbi:hypothetical protein PGIGA_G00029240 [Pangasianodon gigas]|uniref:Uncharacterized protein n=1 Tax=Pangasianodon gigas TaxID=30993 RepID=A0ACC5WXD7_PANGG|nr:hypothetical protein [Pangasianodon gigas]